MTTSTPASLFSLHRLSWIALMAALIAMGSYVTMPIGPVPVTFQDLFVLLTGLVLGPRRGLYAVALYLLAGVAGLPVFHGGKSGIGILAGPTGGYLAGFLLAAFCAGIGGKLARRMQKKAAAANTQNESPVQSPYGRAPRALIGIKPLLAALGCALVGLCLLYAAGVGWLVHTMQFTIPQALTIGVFPFLPFGLSKTLIAVLLWRSLFSRKLLPQEYL